MRVLRSRLLMAIALALCVALSSGVAAAPAVVAPGDPIWGAARAARFPGDPVHPADPISPPDPIRQASVGAHTRCESMHARARCARCRASVLIARRPRCEENDETTKTSRSLHHPRVALTLLLRGSAHSKHRRADARGVHWRVQAPAGGGGGRRRPQDAADQRLKRALATESAADDAGAQQDHCVARCAVRAQKGERSGKKPEREKRKPCALTSVIAHSDSTNGVSMTKEWRTDTR
jgi:hypothetical protein